MTHLPSLGRRVSRVKGESLDSGGSSQEVFFLPSLIAGYG